MRVVLNSTQCRARIAAEHVNCEKFKGEEAMVTCAFHKTTGMITVTCGAVFIDEAEKMLSAVLQNYKLGIKSGEVNPLPEGAQVWGKAMNYELSPGQRRSFTACPEPGLKV